MVYDIIRIGNELYGVNFKFNDINDCDGCKSGNGRLFFGCKDCKIRKCAIEKGIENCAYCEEYACDELLEIFKTDPATKTRLDLIHNSLL